MTRDLAGEAQRHLQRLCVEIATRTVGSAGNRAATDYVAAQLGRHGFAIEQQEFSCMHWTQSGARLTVAGEDVAVHASPYTLGGRVSAPLVVVETIDALESADVTGSIVLLRGEIAREQLFPKNFPFVSMDEHKRIIAALESKQPRAIVAATSRNPQLAGGVYPFPLIEDGDIDIPSVYMTDVEGERLARLAGSSVTLDIGAQRQPATGCNVVARKGGGQRRVVVCAHIDSKAGTPGALDDAAGIITLMLLARLLERYEGPLAVELVAINGEDYYACPGEIVYLERNRPTMDDIVLAINMDGLGYRGSQVAWSLYECPPALAGAVRAALAGQPNLVEGEQWYQGDHMVFVMSGRPALAITTDQLAEICAGITHTERDRPDLVDVSLLAATATALHSLLLVLSSRPDEKW